MDPMKAAAGIGQAIAIFEEMARNAAGITVEKFSPPEGAKGLPTEVQFGFDHRAGGAGAIDLAKFAESFRLFPERRKGTAEVQTLQSFIDLTNRQKTANSVIFGYTSWPDPALTAVINYHTLDAAGNADFGDHRIEYPFPITDEFAKWMGHDTKAMMQHDFAVFVEDRISEIATPDDQEKVEYESLFQTKFATPGEMMLLSRGLEVHVSSAVKTANTLQSGEKEIVFTEAHDTKVVVPGLFLVSVPAFLDSVPVRLPARLRYRVAGGSLVWFYQLYRWKELLRARVVADLATAVKDTSLTAYEGSPEA